MWLQDWWWQLYVDRLRRAGLIDPTLHPDTARGSQLELLIEPPEASADRLVVTGVYGNHKLSWPEGRGRWNLDVQLDSPVVEVPR